MNRTIIIAAAFAALCITADGALAWDDANIPISPASGARSADPDGST